MTREEAIRDIEECVIPYVGGISLRMAVEALKEQRPHGEWKKVGSSVMCSICEHGWRNGHAPKDLKDYNFCPNCGANMRPKEREEND